MLLLKARLGRELPAINKALLEVVETLPASVQPVARHILDAGGKRLRPLLVILTARLLGHDGEDIYPLAACMEMQSGFPSTPKNSNSYAPPADSINESPAATSHRYSLFSL